jgi:hypothetical protein
LIEIKTSSIAHNQQIRRGREKGGRGRLCGLDQKENGAYLRYELQQVKGL